jgi:hypothetical protein
MPTDNDEESRSFILLSLVSPLHRRRTGESHFLLVEFSVSHLINVERGQRQEIDDRRLTAGWQSPASFLLRIPREESPVFSLLTNHEGLLSVWRKPYRDVTSPRFLSSHGHHLLSSLSLYLITRREEAIRQDKTTHASRSRAHTRREWEGGLGRAEHKILLAIIATRAYSQTGASHTET